MDENLKESIKAAVLDAICDPAFIESVASRLFVAASLETVAGSPGEGASEVSIQALPAAENVPEIGYEDCD